jgi:hypothetical protein
MWLNWQCTYVTRCWSADKDGPAVALKQKMNVSRSAVGAISCELFCSARNRTCRCKRLCNVSAAAACLFVVLPHVSPLPTKTPAVLSL